MWFAQTSFDTIKSMHLTDIKGKTIAAETSDKQLVSPERKHQVSLGRADVGLSQRPLPTLHNWGFYYQLSR